MVSVVILGLNSDWYKACGDDIIRTEDHPKGRSSLAVWEIKDNRIYRTSFHPAGSSKTPIPSVE